MLVQTKTEQLRKTRSKWGMQESSHGAWTYLQTYHLVFLGHQSLKTTKKIYTIWAISFPLRMKRREARLWEGAQRCFPGEGREARGWPAPFPSCTWQGRLDWRMWTVAFRDTQCSPGCGTKQEALSTYQPPPRLSEQMTHAVHGQSHQLWDPPTEGHKEPWPGRPRQRHWNQGRITGVDPQHSQHQCTWGQSIDVLKIIVFIYKLETITAVLPYEVFVRPKLGNLSENVFISIKKKIWGRAVMLRPKGQGGVRERKWAAPPSEHLDEEQGLHLLSSYGFLVEPWHQSQTKGRRLPEPPETWWGFHGEVWADGNRQTDILVDLQPIDWFLHLWLLCSSTCSGPPALAVMCAPEGQDMMRTSVWAESLGPRSSVVTRAPAGCLCLCLQDLWNPVGFPKAWGCLTSTVLLTSKAETLRFDFLLPLFFISSVEKRLVGKCGHYAWLGWIKSSAAVCL